MLHHLNSFHKGRHIVRMHEGHCVVLTAAASSTAAAVTAAAA
jgi:hypothetical protein